MCLIYKSGSDISSRLSLTNQIKVRMYPWYTDHTKPTILIILIFTMELCMSDWSIEFFSLFCKIQRIQTILIIKSVLSWIGHFLPLTTKNRYKAEMFSGGNNSHVIEDICCPKFVGYDVFLWNILEKLVQFSIINHFQKWLKYFLE